MSPGLLDSVLRKLPKQTDPNVLIGFDTADDAGVYKLSSDLALVQTVDFFTPIVDDPYIFGQIAAANSLSDVYAMGGRPISALSIVGFPDKAQDLPILEKIIQGGLAIMQQAGCAVIGGHSIGDGEIKFGYAVTGVINPNRILANVGARPGDRLILTKRLGTGVIATALKNERASDESVNASIDSMRTLNRAASETALEFEVHAATDITGFGLLGHAREMAAGSKVSFILDSSRLDFLPGAMEYSRGGFYAGGLKKNREFLDGCIGFADGIPEEIRNLLYDPQTSGGLLFAVHPRDASKLVARLSERGVTAQEVGEVVETVSPLIFVR